MSILKDKDGNDLVRDTLGGITQAETRALSLNIAANNSEVVAAMHGASMAMIHILGTFVATYQIDGSIDGTNYLPIEVFNQATQQAVVASALTAGGIFYANVAGLKQIRVRTSAYTSGTLAVAIRCSSGVNKIDAELMPATLSGTITQAVNTAATLTIAAAGAGLFHYFTRLQLELIAAAAITAAVPVVVTTTNMPGSKAFSLAVPGAAAAGPLQDRIIIEPTNPLKSSVANTNTTFVAPAVTGGIWRLTADYYVGQ